MMEDTETINELSCRICLVPCSPNDIEALSIAKDYKTCVGFEITEEDGALKLCQICMAELSLVKRFHDKCQASELRLIKFRAENWGRLQETGTSAGVAGTGAKHSSSAAHDEPLIPINYNPNEMDITVMPLQMSMHVGANASASGEEPPPVKRGRGRPKKIKPLPTPSPFDGSNSSSHSWWNKNSAAAVHHKSAKPSQQPALPPPPPQSTTHVKLRRNHDKAFMGEDPLNPYNQSRGDPLQFPPPPPPPPLNDRVPVLPNNPLQFLNTNDSKQNHLIHKAAVVAAAAAVMNQQQQHHHNIAAAATKQKVVNNPVPFFCGICNRRFPFKTQHEVQLHMKAHYGAAAGDNPFTSHTTTPSSNYVGGGGVPDPYLMGEMTQFNSRMHHFVYPNKFTQQQQQPKGYQHQHQQRISK